jgi:hypothetical protein
MSVEAAAGVAPVRTRHGLEPIRIVFLGTEVWLQSCCPPRITDMLHSTWATVEERSEAGGALAIAEQFRPQVTVVFDPLSLPAELLKELPGVTLGVLVGRRPQRGEAEIVESLDRVVSFRPELTAVPVGSTHIWRAIPPPVNDAVFAEVRALRGRPRTITVGHSTPHREWMLMPAKHYHDVLQVVHGVSGPLLVELLGEYDVGVYVPPRPGEGSGQQVGMHLAAGQLLLAERLLRTHGLEHNIDYLRVDSPGELVWVLHRMERFPEMYQRIRIRGRFKAEQYRASRLFARIAHDLLADVATFGSERGRG